MSTSSRNLHKKRDSIKLPNWTSDSQCSYASSQLNVRLGLAQSSRELFQPTDFVLPERAITGLVGTNGAGKTSLARALPLLPGFDINIRVEYVSSEDGMAACGEEDSSSASSQTPLEYISAAVDRKLEGLRAQIYDIEETANALEALYELEDRLVEFSGRATERAFDELGFRAHQHKTLSMLSCGWRYKCRLVAAFMVHPDLLIIDEPSFLDSKSTEWFVQSVREASKSSIVLLISHKEYLLNAVCDRILYINSEAKSLTTYTCGYSDFRVILEEQRSHACRVANEANRQEAQAKESLHQMKEKMRRQERIIRKEASMPTSKRVVKDRKGKSKEAKQRAHRPVAAKVKHAERKAAATQELVENARRERVKPLRIEGTVEASGTLVTMQQVAFQYPGECQPIFQNVDLRLCATDRVLVNGQNGCGKSTLVKLLLGELEPTCGHGSALRGKALYFPQTALSYLVQFHGHESAVHYLGKDEMAQTQARQHLGNFGLAKDLALRPIATLSAGQRIRVWLAKQSLVLGSLPSLLILDEISENVDRETRQSLLDLLQAFAGAVVVVSHDEDFCSSFEPAQLWTLGENGVRIDYKDT